MLPENVNQLVTFTMDGEELSFPITTVQEIVRLPEITPVPGAPDSVQGIMNLRGSILPLLDLRKHLELGNAGYSEDSRVIVILQNGIKTGLIVDKVNEVLHVNREQIEPPPPVTGTNRANGLLGLAKIDGGKRVVMILSENNLIPGIPDSHKENTAQTASTSSTEKDLTIEDEKLLVSFRLANEEFAVVITEVREIVRPVELVHIPQAPPFVVGVMPLRNALLPVINLRLRLGMKPSVVDAGQDDEFDTRRIIVADLGGVTTGLLVDAVSEVLRLPEKNVSPIPEVIAPDKAKYLQSVGKLNNGQRLLMLLDLGRLLSVNEKKSVVSMTQCKNKKGKNSMSLENDVGNEKQLVCFRIANEEYGIDIMQVREIIRLDTITSVPCAPAYVSGIVNLRGNVLPVIDLRRLFGRSGAQRSEQNRILVVEEEGRTTGLIVDAVNEVLRIPEGNIESTPRILSNEMSGRYFSGIGKLDGGNRAIILVNTKIILDQQEEDGPAGTDSASYPPENGGEPSSCQDDTCHASTPNDKQSDGFSVNDKTTAAIEETEDTGKNEGSYQDAENPKDLSENDVEMITGAIEKSEGEKTTGDKTWHENTVRILLGLKKDELLAKAKQIGLKVNKKMTKKQLAGLLAEQEK